MSKYKVDDIVIVPYAYSAIFEPHLAVIKEIYEKDHKDIYVFSFRVDACRKRVEYEEKYLFPHNEKGLQDCKKFIQDYYYGGLCRGCKYDDCGTVWRCEDCSHCKIAEKIDLRSEKRVCELSGLCVGSTERLRLSNEICKNFLPRREADKKDFVSWEYYDETLRNCLFNPHCIHHQKSAHKTCDYSYYMTKYVKVNIPFIFNGRKVKKVIVTRTRWINQDFIDGDIIRCYGLDFCYEKNKRGLPRKEDCPTFMYFCIDETLPDLGCKEVIINIKTGEIVGETGKQKVTIINDKVTNINDVKLFEVVADYRPKNLSKPRYYVVADSVKEAKKKFADRITWLKIYSCSEIKDREKVKEIVGNPMKHIVF